LPPGPDHQSGPRARIRPGKIAKIPEIFENFSGAARRGEKWGRDVFYTHRYWFIRAPPRRDFPAGRLNF
jgi:hypothetical protein